MKKEIYLILHNIRSLYNVGSIFRTADAAGIKKIYLTGYTPTPIDKFGKIRTEIHKTSLGAETTVEWQKYEDVGKLIDFYQGRSLIVGVEQSPKAINFKKFKPKYPLVLIFGNEVRGVSPQILKKCDQIIEIPMHGKKESLNVSVSTGIILFSI